MADLEQERVTALWREAASVLEVSASTAMSDPVENALRSLRGYGCFQTANELEAECGRLREQLDALATTATEYQEAVRLAGSYPGHEAFIHSEFVEILGRLDDADMALDDRLTVARAALGVVGEQEKPQ